MVIPSNSLTLPCRIGLWLKVFWGTVQKSRSPDSSWGRWRESWYHRSPWGDVSCFCQEKGVLFQSYSKMEIEHPLIPCCGRRDWDGHCIMKFNRAEMGSRHKARSAFQVSLLTNSARTQIHCPNMPVFFRKLNLVSVILNRSSQINYFLQQWRRILTQEGVRHRHNRVQKTEESLPMVMTVWRSPKSGILTAWKTLKGGIFTVLSGKPLFSSRLDGEAAMWAGE